jgi:AGCS family alanine or glycine:cation symporter
MPQTIFRLFAALFLCASSVRAQTPAPETPPPAPTPAPAITTAEEKKPATLDEKIDQWFGKTAAPFVNAIFFMVEIDTGKVKDGKPVLLRFPGIVLWLAAAGISLTLIFKFVNVRALGLALRTVRGKYSKPDDPGEVTHFQALSAAVSGTVGLGNIAGVAIGITMGGPGVAFWLFLAGFLGMTTKFVECTLGVKYRIFDTEGHVHGGPMYYLRRGLKEIGLGPLGIVLAGLFAVFCVFASFGGGNIFQVNQTAAQFITVTGGEESFLYGRQWIFGLFMAVLTALVILGGLRSIARVTDKLVPSMTILYVASCLIVLLVNAGNIPGAISTILTEAFQPKQAVIGGALAAFIWGMRRATFSNEAGIGSAPIAHAAAKTGKPASEGIVALLEPFLDTVVICTMTALVLVVTGSYEIGGGDGSTGYGIQITSKAFETVHHSFRYVLFACVFLFAFSTLITWSYYGLQAWQYIFGKSKAAAVIYKVIFCIIIVVGSAASMSNAVDFSDASLFAMSIPNLLGVYLLLPKVKREYNDFVAHAKEIDAKG